MESLENREIAYEAINKIRKIIKEDGIGIGDAEAIFCTLYAQVLYIIKIKASHSNEEVVEMAKLGLLDCLENIDEEEKERKNDGRDCEDRLYPFDKA